MRRHVGYWFEAIARGLPGLSYLLGLMTLAVGGSVAVVVLWGKDHLAWSIVILLAALVVSLAEGVAVIGRERDDAKNAPPQTAVAAHPARRESAGYRSRNSDVTYVDSSAIGYDIGFDNEGGVVEHHRSTALAGEAVDAALRRARKRNDGN
jgi:hypothetical protein